MSEGGDDLWALRRLAEAQRLQDWMFSVLRPSGPGPMLEIGAGIGTFSTRLLEAGADPLLLVEPEDHCAAVSVFPPPPPTSPARRDAGS